MQPTTRTPPEPSSPRRRRRAVPSWIVSLALAGCAAALLLRELASPADVVFDEVYYVGDARDYLALGGIEATFAVHPPLGKWFIAAGIRLLGDTALGWRVPGAVAGVLLVVVLHRLALRLLRGRPHGALLAALAPALLLLDGVFLVQARTAMLDVFLALLVVLGVHLVVVDRDLRRLGGSSLRATRRRGTRGLAGVALGAALAVKWSALLGIGVAGLLALVWELALRRRATGRWLAAPGRLVAGIGLPLVVVPALVYAAAWIPWAAVYERTEQAGCTELPSPECTFDLRGRAEAVADHNVAMWNFHRGLEAEHPYRSDALGWPVLARPVVYHYETCGPDREAGLTGEDGEVPAPCVVEPGQASEIILVGNPALWWGFLLLSPLLVAGAVRRDRASAVALVGWLGQYLPWLAVSRPAFLFYLVPAVPFAALGLALALGRLRDPAGTRWTWSGALAGAAGGWLLGSVVALALGTGPRPGWLLLAAGWVAGAAFGAVLDARSPRWQPPDASATGVGRLAVPAAVAGVLLVAVGLAVFFLPVWTGTPLPEELVRQRWWFDSWV